MAASNLRVQFKVENSSPSRLGNVNADFGTCAVDWPLMEVWEQELSEGKLPS